MEHVDRLDLPKGHVDAGESDMQCALRELEEETGIMADDIEIDSDFEFTTQYVVRPKKHDYQPCEKTVVIYLARLVRDVDIRLTEHVGYQWNDWPPPSQFDNPTIDPLLAQLADHLRG